MSYSVSMEIKILFLGILLGALAGIIFYSILKILKRRKQFPYLGEKVPTPRDVYLKTHQKKRENGQDSNI